MTLKCRMLKQLVKLKSSSMPFHTAKLFTNQKKTAQQTPQQAPQITQITQNQGDSVNNTKLAPQQTPQQVHKLHKIKVTPSTIQN